MLANLENVSLTRLNLDKNACIYFTRARLKNIEIRRKDIEDHIAQEKEKKFSETKEVYLLLKNNFHSLGRYDDDESWAFKKEKDRERKSYFHFLRLYIDQELGGSQNGKPNFCLCPRAWWFCLRYSLKWSASMFSNILYGYGQRPFWILAWCAGLLLLSSVIYWMSKGILKIVGVRTISVEDYWNSLYFSVVTFTTLRYGDFRPIGKVKILASIEAILGIFFVALLIITFARKTAGR